MIPNYKRPEYRAWLSMKYRTTATAEKDIRNFRNYAARGIRVCPEWIDNFEAFFDHIGERPGPGYSVDRIDNARGYEPHNVRWATPAEQMRNRRITVWITYRGVTLTTDQWAAILGCDVPTLSMRKRRGWSDERTIETPIGPSKNRKPGARDRGPHRGKGLIAAFERSVDGDAR